MVMVMVNGHGHGHGHGHPHHHDPLWISEATAERASGSRVWKIV